MAPAEEQRGDQPQLRVEVHVNANKVSDKVFESAIQFKAEATNKEPTENSRGLRLGNMVQLRDVWAEEFEAALSGKKTAKQALDDAVSRGNQMLRQFERTISR